MEDRKGPMILLGEGEDALSDAREFGASSVSPPSSLSSISDGCSSGSGGTRDGSDRGCGSGSRSSVAVPVLRTAVHWHITIFLYVAVISI